MGSMSGFSRHLLVALLILIARDGSAQNDGLSEARAAMAGGDYARARVVSTGRRRSRFAEAVVLRYRVPGNQNQQCNQQVSGESAQKAHWPWIIICPMKSIGRFLIVFVLLSVPVFASRHHALRRRPVS